jgi:hypothetical protein
MSATLQNMLKCSNCELIVDDDSNFCKKCGYAIKRYDNLIDITPNDILGEIYKHIDNKLEINFKFDNSYDLNLHIYFKLNNNNFTSLKDINFWFYEMRTINPEKIKKEYMNKEYLSILCTEREHDTKFRLINNPININTIQYLNFMDRELKNIECSSDYTKFCLYDYIDKLKNAINYFNTNNDKYIISIDGSYIISERKN